MTPTNAVPLKQLRVQGKIYGVGDGCGTSSFLTRAEETIVIQLHNLDRDALVLSKDDMIHVMTSDSKVPMLKLFLAPRLLQDETWLKLSGIHNLEDLADRLSQPFILLIADIDDPEVYHSWIGCWELVRQVSLKLTSLNSRQMFLQVQPGDEIVLQVGAHSLARSSLLKIVDKRAWLNDECINVAAATIFEDNTTCNAALADQVVLANTFLFKKLDAGKAKDVNCSLVKSWHSDIFEKHYFVIPIELPGLHWILAVVCHPEAVFEYGQESKEPPGPGESFPPKCRILLMDSFLPRDLTNRNRIFRIVREYLRFMGEAAGVTNKTASKNAWFNGIENHILKVPQGTDHLTSAEFTLHFMKRFLQVPDRVVLAAVQDLDEHASKDLWMASEMKNGRAGLASRLEALSA
ncbi:hypothetical protein FRC07_010720, partial [Ceratobasidium sp. 392]